MLDVLTIKSALKKDGNRVALYFFDAPDLLTLAMAANSMFNVHTFTDFAYTGNSITPAINVTYNNETLVEGEDYTLSGDTSATEIGNYTITLTGTETCRFTKTFKWHIVDGDHFSVTVIGGFVVDPQETYAKGEAARVKANEEQEGYGWYLNGQLVSIDTAYAFYILNNSSLEYKALTTADAEKIAAGKGIVASDISERLAISNEKQSVTVVSRWKNLPNGVTFIEAGTYRYLVTGDREVTKEEIIAGNNYKKSASESISGTVYYNITMSGFYLKQKLYVVSAVKYELNGEVKTIYSDIACSLPTIS